MSLRFETVPAPHGGLHVLARDAHGTASYATVFRAWSRAGRAGAAWGATLGQVPMKAFALELPRLTVERVDEPFQCMVISDPALDRHSPDPSPFRKSIPDDVGEVATISSLGGDAVLVVPVPADELQPYAHLAAFCRSAPESVQGALWAAVADAAMSLLSERPVWLSTSGHGVHWLHVRLDERPKYYQYAPYRDEA